MLFDACQNRPFRRPSSNRETRRLGDQQFTPERLQLSKTLCPAGVLEDSLRPCNIGALQVSVQAGDDFLAEHWAGLNGQSSSRHGQFMTIPGRMDANNPDGEQLTGEQAALAFTSSHHLRLYISCHA